MPIVKTYLPKRIHTLFILLIISFLFFFSLKYAFFCALLYFLILFLFRKNKKSFFRDINSSTGLIFSPVFGRLISIKKNISHQVFGQNLIELRFIIPLGSEIGLYLPTQVEISDFILKRGSIINRYKKKFFPDQADETLDSPMIKIQNKNNEILGLQFVECTFGLFPHFYIMPGDRGMALANFGYFPFGGTVLLYLPGNYEILVKENNRVFPGETLIASSKV